MFISVDQLNESAQRYEQTSAALRDAAPIAAPIVATAGRASQDRRKAMIQQVGAEPLDFAFERVIGSNDSVYSNFVELLASAKRKVGRVVVRQATRVRGYATGFMVTDRLLLTNWHVFNNKEDATDSEVQFGYEFDTHGVALAPVVFQLDTETFFDSRRELDYCLVAVNPLDVAGKQRLADISYLYLDARLGKLDDNERERLNIIHHPDGDYKQLSIRENQFVRMTPSSVWYRTDTAPGSSGSPVLNDQWQVVALHHMGVAKKKYAGRIRRQGQPGDTGGGWQDRRCTGGLGSQRRYSYQCASEQCFRESSRR